MGLLKLVGKAVGSVALSAAGVVSSVGKEVSNAVGADGAAGFFDTLKDGSFNGVKGMWKDVDVGEELKETVQNLPGVIEGFLDNASNNMSSKLSSLEKKAIDEDDFELLDKVENTKQQLDNFNSLRSLFNSGNGDNGDLE